MMKALTLEEMGSVTGGWTLTLWRQFVLSMDTYGGILLGYSLEEIQDKYCDTDEERKYVKLAYKQYTRH